MTDRKKLISIVTPCFNEEANVETHFARVSAALAPLRERYDFEHVYTDNCSSDRTWELLGRLAAEQANVRAVRFSRNLGAAKAVILGLGESRGDAVVLLHADLQDPPELIPEFIRGWEDGWDVVYGQILDRDEGTVMKLFRRLYYRIISRLSDVPIPENAGDFRITSRRVLDAVLQYKEDDIYLRGAVAHAGFRQKPLPYHRAARAGGTSSAPVSYLVAFALNGLLSTTVVPIRAVVLLGLLTSAIGFGFLAFFLIGKLLDPASAPWGFSTLASLLAFFVGIQMLALGIIGEYIRKIYVQTLYRPRGFIMDRVGYGKDSGARETESG